jgi:hypothetical protein
VDRPTAADNLSSLRCQHFLDVYRANTGSLDEVQQSRNAKSVDKAAERAAINDQMYVLIEQESIREVADSQRRALAGSPKYY